MVACATIALLVAVPGVQAAFPGENGRIAFQSGGAIELVDPDGGGRARLTPGPSDSAPAWAPDGGRLAFSRNSDIYVVNADGTGARTVWAGPASDHAPTWSPDGQRIAYSWIFDDPPAQISLIGADGGTPETLTTGSDASWSPDGARLALARYQAMFGRYDIFVHGVDGLSGAKLTDGPVGHNTDPDWSPDGSRIAFSSTRDGHLEIYSMTYPGGVATRLTNTPVGSSHSPAWSPDGSRIAFVSSRDGNSEIYTMNVDGSDQRRITFDPAADVEPSWQPASPASPPPPPPPPGPPPPQVASVGAAAPVAPGGAAVVRAQISGDATRVEWDVDGDGRPEIAAAPGQTGFRFRPRPGQRTTVAVRAVGPGGASPFVGHEVAAPSAPKGQFAARVDRRVAALPPVYAVGAPEVLAGTVAPPPAACGAGAAQSLSRLAPTTVSAGALTVSGALSPATALKQIPAAERGVLQPVAKALRLPPTQPALSAAVLGSDSYVAKGAVTLNRDIALTPRCGSGGRALSSLVVAPQGKAIAASRATLTVAGASLPLRDVILGANPAASGGKAIAIATGGFNGRAVREFRSDIRKQNPDLDRALSQLGATLVGEPNILGLAAGASVTVNIKLPPWLERAGFSGEVRVKLEVVEGRIVVDDLRIGPIDANIGALKVNGFQVDYKRSQSLWTGRGRACVIGGTCLDMIPSRGEIRVRNGELEFAGATLQFPPGAVQLFPSVSLDWISFKVGRNPTRMFGELGVGVAQIVEINGGMFIAFPTAQHPFRLTPAEMDGFPAHLYARTYRGTTMGVRAQAFIRLPVIGRARLAHAHMLYEHPSYIAFGGGFDLSLLSVGGIKGEMTGIVDGNGPETIYLFRGGVSACLNFIGSHCASAEGVISRGNGNTGGAGVCFGPIGGGVQWPNRGNGNRTQVFLYPPGAGAFGTAKCSIVRFTALDFRARASANTHVVRIRPGDGAQAIRLDGAGGPPRVQVSGPGGRVLRGDSEVGFDLAPDRALGIASYAGRGETEGQDFTVVSINDPRPGTYRIQTLAGSPAIRAVSAGAHPSRPRIAAEVRGSGLTRELRYRVGRRPGQRVVFYEVTATGAAKRVGTVSGGGRGKVRFTPAPGGGQRRIEAQVEIDGLPAERLRVARFRPPTPQLGRPTGLRTRRVGARLVASWRRVPGAARYEVVVTMSDRAQRVVTTKRRQVSLKGVPATTAGQLSVRAVDRLRVGRAAVRPFARKARPRTGVRALPRCATRKARLICR